MEQDIILDVTVSPKSSRQKITLNGNKIKVYLHSPPVEGKANAECIELFSKKLGIAKSKIAIHRGSRGRDKKIKITGLSMERALSLLGEDK